MQSNITPDFTSRQGNPTPAFSFTRPSTTIVPRTSTPARPNPIHNPNPLTQQNKHLSAIPARPPLPAHLALQPPLPEHAGPRPLGLAYGRHQIQHSWPDPAVRGVRDTGPCGSAARV
ncbi:hypothetical protein BJX70DRAFT_404052 [Aspergillus crustosus]